jgi:hypothetical protein
MPEVELMAREQVEADGEAAMSYHRLQASLSNLEEDARAQVRMDATEHASAMRQSLMIESKLWWVRRVAALRR